MRANASDNREPPWPISIGVALPAAGDASDNRLERVAQLTAARDMLASALVILDVYARSHAAATVDLAIHLLNAEIAG